MSYTIEAAFEHLFDAASERGAEAYARRLWFRRPGLREDDDTTASKSAGDIEAAERMLLDRVVERAAEWAAGPRKAAAKRKPTAGPKAAASKPAAAAVAVEPLDPVRHLPPRMPYDVFAVAAHLIETAGVYHHLQPVKTPAATAATAGLRHIDITREDRDTVRTAAEAWASLPQPASKMTEFAGRLLDDEVWPKLEPLFESWWFVFSACANEEVFHRLEDEAGAIPTWWKHAWRLLAISDEAARGTAFQFDLGQMIEAISGKKTSIRWFELDVMIEHIQRALAATEGRSIHHGRRKAQEKVQEFDDITSLSAARAAVASVLPKVRTAAVGCTLRSLSHHLALLPPAGVARGRWTPNYFKPKAAGGSMPEGVMNLLLVPMPFSLRADSFVAGPIEDVSGGEEKEVPRFGYFDVNQHWITDSPARPAEIISFLQALIAEAQKQSPHIHGVVLPELSLDHDTFALVRDHIRKTLPTADILVSGVSSDATGRKGNYVAVASFPDASSGDDRDYRQTIREKHHRWKLERAQLKDYGLLGVLSPELSWWENIALQNRRVDFTVLRRESVLAAMICEDLARVDPCQQVIRSVGPNLVVALLMDAPQLAARWPARYATVLAEDPGCSVLTLTSRGLMTRQHRLGIFRSNGDDRVVGLWRDDRSAVPIELKCPFDAQGVLLTVVAESAEDISLDGRSDCEAKAWRYVGDVPIRIPKAKETHRTILGEEDVACW